MKRISLLFSILFFFTTSLRPEAAALVFAEATSEPVTVSAPSVLLMEAETGTVLYQKKEHDTRPPASITKIMTLNLIFDALENKQISLEDEVTVSEHAASMGGSQVFLEPGEVQTVETMIKCISISSANDACVAMAEFISGSEEAFVEQMNQKARALGMQDTTFVNSCGLDTKGHLTSAYDVALMSRELTVKHPQIHDYCTVWMDTITHTTKRGSSEFGLTNTNKLIRQYPYATGLKTGSTGKAKYCLSATASKDGVELIAVIMAAPDPKARFQDAQALLNYGFSICRLYKDENKDALAEITVRQGNAGSVPVYYEGAFTYASTNGEDLSNVRKELTLPDTVTAPVKKGETAGFASYYLGDTLIGQVNILYGSDVLRASFKDYFFQLLKKTFMIRKAAARPTYNSSVSTSSTPQYGSLSSFANLS